MSVIFFATESYGLPILRPLQKAASERGVESAWIVTDALAAHLSDDEPRLESLQQVRHFNPETVFSAANWVSPTLPGKKVQIFHGFSSDKRSRERGHFRVRGFFDLYCTQGPNTTEPFQALAQKHGYFSVCETGWPKMDPLFGPQTAGAASLVAAAAGRPIAMYASTFTPRLSSAPDMLETLTQLVARGDRYWLLTLHPKCSEDLFKVYRELADKYPENATFLETEHAVDMLQAADVLVSDTSSIIHEMAVQLKPVVTIQNNMPQDFMVDVRAPSEVDQALSHAQNRPERLMQRIRAHADNIHPYRDGGSSERVLDAAAGLAARPNDSCAMKPINPWRRMQARKNLQNLLST